MKSTITYLIKKGYTHREAAKRLNVSPDRVLTLANQFGLKFENKPKRPDLIDSDIVKALLKRNYSVNEIAKILNKNVSSIGRIVTNNNFKRNLYKKLTKKEKAIICGTLLGDSTLRRTKLQTSLSCGHSLAQKEYLDWKVESLKKLNIKTFETKRFDERTNKFYFAKNFYSEATSSLNEFYDKYYVPKKEINVDILKYYKPISLAIHYMDDGFKRGTSYMLATDCFSLESLNVFITFCKVKFDIIWVINKKNRLYLPVKYKKRFESLITPYMHPTLMYKLHI